jgi:hypothetical protein
MRSPLRILAVGAAILIVASALAPWAPAAPADTGEAVLAVFSFTSPDDGRAGKRFTDSLRLRARRLGLMIVDPLSLKEAMAGAETPGQSK